MEPKFFIYPYGRFRENCFTKNIGENTIIVYTIAKDIDEMIVGPLEGIFISLNPLGSLENSLCERTEMGDVEKKYSGKFHKFP
mgnify:CR=1 FL=1